MYEPTRDREAALDEAEMHRIRNLLMSMGTGKLLYFALCIPAEELVEHVRLLLASQSDK